MPPDKLCDHLHSSVLVAAVHTPNPGKLSVPVTWTETSCKDELLSSPMPAEHGILRIVLLQGQRDQETMENSEGTRLNKVKQSEETVCIQSGGKHFSRVEGPDVPS